MSPEKKYYSLHNHALFISSLFVSTYICEQLFSRMKHTENKTRKKTIENIVNILNLLGNEVSEMFDIIKHLTNFISK